MQPTNLHTIKRCPFCGDDGRVETIKPANPYQSESWYVACTSCGANGPITDENPGRAIEKWNWRALLSNESIGG